MSRRARDQVPSGDELWSKVIHKIVELGVALNLDSWYYVIRNRVLPPNDSSSVSHFAEQLGN